MLGRHSTAAESPPLTMNEEMKEIFSRLVFSKTVAQKPVEDQGIISPWILASLFDEDITTICDIIRRPEGLVNGRKLDKGNLISALVAKNLMLAAFMFKSMKNCSKAYDIRHVDSTSVLHYQHKWELEQKKTDILMALKVGINNWEKTMENIMLHMKLIRGVIETLLGYVVQLH